MLTLSERLTIWSRLLILQAAWSYRRMQTNGWLWVAEVVSRRKGKDAARWLTELVVEFNTHSLLAPLLLGAALRELVKDDPDMELAKRQLTRWMGSFGALGDMIYWQAMWWTFVSLACWTYLSMGPLALFWLCVCWVMVEVVFRVLLFEIGLQKQDGIAYAMRFLNTAKIRERVSFWAVLVMCLFGGYIFVLAIEYSGAATDALAVGLAAATIAIAVSYQSRFRATAFWLPIAFGILYSLLQ